MKAGRCTTSVSWTGGLIERHAHDCFMVDEHLYRCEWTALFGDALPKPKTGAYLRGLVYFVERDGFVKIGYTTRLASRMSSLRTDQVMHGISPGPVALIAAIDGSKEDEKRLHERFASCRIAGEWFLPDGALTDFIAAAASRSVA